MSVGSRRNSPLRFEGKPLSCGGSTVSPAWFETEIGGGRGGRGGEGRRKESEDTRHRAPFASAQKRLRTVATEPA